MAGVFQASDLEKREEMGDCLTMAREVWGLVFGLEWAVLEYQTGDDRSLLSLYAIVTCPTWARSQR
jgi:hypothetical protein